jgi:hypothetical protein
MRQTYGFSHRAVSGLNPPAPAALFPWDYSFLNYLEWNLAEVDRLIVDILDHDIL